VACLLLVEDDDTIGTAIRARLVADGHEVRWARDGAAALADGGRSPDLVLLDLGLPDVDGTDLCRRLRVGHPESVIVVVTARDDEMDVVEGLEAGADDYLVKPVGAAELSARVGAHLRRAGTRDGAPTRLAVGHVVLDLASRRATVADREVRLRAKEFDLLARLCAEPGIAVRRETLMSEVWDEHWSGSTKTLDVHVAALRRKLGPEAAMITTVRGHGYRLDPVG
jgi:DNA-binding response OmpR family regulator